MLDTSKWPSEANFCESYTCSLQKKKQTRNGPKRVILKSTMNFYGTDVTSLTRQPYYHFIVWMFLLLCFAYHCCRIERIEQNSIWLMEEIPKSLFFWVFQCYDTSMWKGKKELWEENVHSKWYIPSTTHNIIL